jgi:tagaturonate reductase
MKLSRSLITSGFKFPGDIAVPPAAADRPERVLQFGEGNFLRAFADWMIHRMNGQGLFNGKAVVVQPIEQGLVDAINEQDGLFTLILRGIQGGGQVVQKEIISSISRGLNPYKDWSGFLSCAKNPDLRVIVSNTTEAGIAYYKEPFKQGKPLESFPGKLAAFLYRRFNAFKGAADKGLLVLPCELIEKNGEQLKNIVLTLAKEWDFSKEFENWLNRHVHFFNSMVDRIVTGYPHHEIADLTKELGYEDRLLDTGEIFHLWVIEGDRAFGDELPFKKAGLNVIWVDDLTPYRSRKVRILNGVHTMTVPVSFLYGLDTVKESIDDGAVGNFMRQAIFKEIIPMLDLPDFEKNSYAQSVIERFQNPFIRHQLIDISLNSVSKFKTRCLPTLLDYMEKRGEAPKITGFSLAALIAFYRGGRMENHKLVAQRQDGEYRIADDGDVLAFFLNAWSNYRSEDPGALKGLVKKVLGNTGFWDMDLNRLPGLCEFVSGQLASILQKGPRQALLEIL